MAGARQEARAEPATADREIVISRLISAPRELVFEAFTQVRHLSRWGGREGLTPPTRPPGSRVAGGGGSRRGPGPGRGRGGGDRRGSPPRRGRSSSASAACGTS